MSPHTPFARTLLWLLAAMTTASAAQLHIRVVDESARPLWTRVEVRGAAGRMYHPPDAILDRTTGNRFGGEPWYQGSFVVHGECRLELAPGSYTVIAEHGLEYERAETKVQVLEDRPAELALTLRPWVRMRERGWWSGDLHVHRTLEEMPALALAEDIQLSVVFTMWNKRSLWRDRPLPADPVLRLSPHHLATILNAEDERGGGAWLLDSLHEPIDLAVDGRWFPAGVTFVRRARAQRRGRASLPWFDSEKPIWWEVPVMMAIEPPDSLGVLHNHYCQYGILDNEAWGRPRDQKAFPGREGFVGYCLSLYYRYLNLGLRLAPSAGSASGVLPNPVGYNRVYVRGAGELSVPEWYRAFREGPSFVTNGPILFFDVKGRGARKTATFEVLARAPLDRVELIANGRLLQRFTPPPGAKTFRAEYSFDGSPYSWVAARCFLVPGATIRLAHSSPVYLAGRWDARADARFFLDWIDDLVTQTRADAKRFRNAEERDQVLALYQQARAFYQQRTR